MLLENRINKYKAHPAFSAAEMLLVLLIVSFLILATPPLVHKKVVKRLIRGEHGRYECWLGADGRYHQYYATEKSGPQDDITNGSIVARCSFDPKTQAPNAAYFMFQAIGGGGGGTYPEYNSLPDASGTSGSYGSASVYLQNDIHNPGDAAVEHETEWSWSYNKMIMAINADSGTYSRPNTEWIKKFFPPVKSTVDVEFCSPRGAAGKPSTSQGVVDNSTTPQSQVVLITKGQAGSRGLCIKASAGKIYLPNSGSFGYKTSEVADYKYYYVYDYPLQPVYYSSRKIFENKDNNPGVETVAQADRVYTQSHHGADIIACPPCSGDNRPSLESGGSNITISSHFTNDSSASPTAAGITVPHGNVGPDAGAAAPAPATPVISWPSGTRVFNSSGNNNAGRKLPRGSEYGNNQIISGVGSYIFPPKIDMEARYSYDTPTMAFAGTSGEALSMILPKLTNQLSFTIGQGGQAGTVAQPTGNGGGSTTVYSNGTAIMVAKGGKGFSGTVRGSKIWLHGSDTCGEGVTLGINTCLTGGFHSDNRRYTNDSGFYTIEELEPNSNTPSALKRYFEVNGWNMPGTGGLGGYSFVAHTDGIETYNIRNHNNISKASLVRARPALAPASYYNSFSEYGTSSNKTFSRSVNDAAAALKASYRCTIPPNVNPVPNNLTIPEYISGGKIGVCRPDHGTAGAVVIVW